MAAMMTAVSVDPRIALEIGTKWRKPTIPMPWQSRHKKKKGKKYGTEHLGNRQKRVAVDVHRDWAGGVSLGHLPHCTPWDYVHSMYCTHRQHLN